MNIAPCTAVLLKWRCYSWWSFCELKFSYSKARRDNPPPVLKNLKIKMSSEAALGWVPWVPVNPSISQITQ